MDELNTDGRGLFYNISPILPEKGTIHIYINPMVGYGRRTGICDTSYGEPNDQRRKPCDRHYYGTAIVGLGWVFSEQLEIMAGVHGYSDYIERGNWPLKRTDTRFICFPQLFAAIKAGFPQLIDSYVLAFGFTLWYAHWVDKLVKGEPHSFILDEFDYASPTEWKQNIEVGIRGISALETPIGKTYLNLGYLRIIKKGKQYGFNSFGIGQEFYLWQYLHPGIELVKQDTIGAIIPQVKLLVPHFTINVGLAFPLFAQFDWVPNDTLERTPRIMISLNPYIVIKKKPKPEPNIVITGRVYDSLSLKPLPAVISFLGPVSGKIEVKAGEYRLEFVHEGAYEIGIESPDFKWEQRVFHLMAYDTVIADWPLKRLNTWSIKGKVVDIHTKEALPATIELRGKKHFETVSDPKTGRFKIWGNAGVYSFSVSAEGYHPIDRKIKITNDKTIEETIYLLSSKYPRSLYPKLLKKVKKSKKGTSKRKRRRR